MNPAGAEKALAPRPEAFPTAQVHPVGEMKCESFEAGESPKFFGRWLTG
jgi:hypothetical protein